MTELALALAAGAALSSAGVVLWPAALCLVAALIRPIRSSRRPRFAAGAGSGRLRALAWAGIAGLAHGHVASARGLRDCRWSIPEGEVQLAGWVRTVETPGRFQLTVVEGACPRPVRVQAPLPRASAEGSGVRVRGRWVRRSEAAPGVDPLRAGQVVAAEVESAEVVVRDVDRWSARTRARGLDAVDRRFRREAPLVSALLFARRDRIDPALRDAFSATGTAHLLAISGFHVGVLAGGVIALVGRMAPPRRAFAAGAGVAWLYVAVLGFPDAATRAALLLTLASLGRWMGRPVAVSGAVGTALAALVLIDPAVAGRIGAQLSFAGALGLALFTRPWTATIVDRWRRWRGEAPGPRVRVGVEAVVATTAASLATLPFVAWHFERVPTVGLPASVVATPLVALALPSVVTALGLDALGLPGAAVPAAGAEGLLALARGWVGLWARFPGASVAIDRTETLAATLAVVVGLLLTRWVPRVGGVARGAAAVAGLAAALLVWPVARQMARNGALEVYLFDVGQGDALGIRTPEGRWIVVDAGPPTGRRLAADLRRVGARSIEMLLLSHPDADHVGGAAALLDEFPVETVVGPGTLRGDGPWRGALVQARSRAVPWRVVARGDRVALDGVVLRVLHPSRRVDGAPREANDASLVVELSWRGFRLLLTGDISVEVERSLVEALGPVDVLKVAHHGSRTSTDSLFVARIRPEWAVVSVGRGNRYGHPAPEVMARLEGAGSVVWRTDRSGALRLRIDRSGAIEAKGAGRGAR
ncbi:MAG: DNA internalization-related competence protein ComEC/Rec2 [Gemmatimonadetes bacterium]|nr:DNA internalization-related competence protein ComEC/Rec2 [Gemmatimonadota bacterium]